MVSTPNPAPRQPKQTILITNRNKTRAHDSHQVTHAETHNERRNTQNSHQADFYQAAEGGMGDQIYRQHQDARYVQNREIGVTDTRNVYCDTAVPPPTKTQSVFKRRESGNFQAPPRPKRQPPYTISKQQEPYANSYNQYDDQAINPRPAPDALHGSINNHPSRGPRNVMQAESRIHSEHTLTGFNEGPNTYFVDSSRPSATSQGTKLFSDSSLLKLH